MLKAKIAVENNSAIIGQITLPMPDVVLVTAANGVETIVV